MNTAVKANGNQKVEQHPFPKTVEARQFDIDNYLNPLIPRSCLHLFPRPLSYFLGYRSPTGCSVLNATPKASVFYLACFIGTFAGIAITEGIYRILPNLGGHQVPIIIGSFGAAAILEYNAVQSPFSQPRNLIFGHAISTLIGICVTKLFALLPSTRFEGLRWLVGALSVAFASIVMHFTKTIHPPAGATAILAATSPEITQLGWWLLPLILLGCTIMLLTACLINNIAGLRFPMYWWTSIDLAALHRQRSQKEDIESSSAATTTTTNSDALHTTETNKDSPSSVEVPQLQPIITVTPEKIAFSAPITLTDWEENFLLHLQGRLTELVNGGIGNS